MKPLFKDTLKIVQRIYDRNVEGWEEDEGTFTAKPKAKAKKPAAKKAVKKVKKVMKGRRSRKKDQNQSS